MADFSVVIPVLNEAQLINRQINCITSQSRKFFVEIIVVDGNRKGSTISAITNSDVVKLISSVGRGSQMNIGAARAKGAILVFLHVDTILPEDAFERIYNCLKNQAVVGGAFDLDIDSDKKLLKIIACLARQRSRVTRIPYGDQAIFVRRKYFQSIGGYKQIPLMEDLDLMRRIKKAGDKIQILPQRVITSARRWEKRGTIYTSCLNQILLLLYYLGVSPDKLANIYRVGLTCGKVKNDGCLNSLCVIFFVKWPQEGKCKTRLAKDIGVKKTTELYKSFVLDLLDMLSRFDFPLRVYFTPENCRDRLIDWLGNDHEFIAQKGDNLGRRMKNAFEQTFQEGFEWAILIGSDSPDLPPNFLNKAFWNLEEKDAVLGPCDDGGYYLIGFSNRGFCPEAFKNIKWGSGEVFEKTKNILTNHGRTIGLLPIWHDIDDACDLRKINRNAVSTNEVLRNIRCLSKAVRRGK